MRKITRRTFIYIGAGIATIAITNPTKALADENATVEAENARHNAEVAKAWSKSVSNSRKDGYEVVVVDPNKVTILPKSYALAQVTHSRSYGIYTAQINFSCSFNKTTNQNGTPIIGQIYNISATAADSWTTITVLDSRYIYADGQRTVIANFTLLVGVGNGYLQETYTTSFHVEFYASGNAYVF